MSAQDNMQPKQLAMFMTPKEIVSGYNALNGDREGGDDSWGGSPSTATRMFGSDSDSEVEGNDRVWERKADEADDDGRANDFIQEGVRQPIPLSTIPTASTSAEDNFEARPQVLNGHHRIAAMARHDQETGGTSLLPVEHYESEQVQFPRSKGGVGYNTGDRLPKQEFDKYSNNNYGGGRPWAW